MLTALKSLGRSVWFLVGALTLAAGAGFLSSQALGIGSQGPARTTTIHVGTGATGPAGQQGPQGPAGPAGPTGPSGAISCPVGFDPGLVVLEHESGSASIWTCLKE